MKTRILIVLWVALLAAGGCKKDPLNANAVIGFDKPDQENWPADNYSLLKLTVLVPPDSDPQTAVVFTTDIGTFLNGTSNTVTVYADASGSAVTYIKCGTVGVATVKASAGTTYTASKSVNFTAPDPNTIFTVGTVASQVPADGVSTAVFTAALNKSLPATAQSIVFTADNGATFNNGTATITVAADGSGNAVAYLKSSTIGPVHVSLSSAGVIRTYVVNFVAPDPDNIFTVGPVTDHLPADGVTAIVLNCALNKNLPAGAKAIVFTADNGASFSNNSATATLTPDGAGNVTAYLRNTVAGPVHVAMSSSNVTRNLIVNFDRSFPDNILLTAPPSLASGFGNSLPVSITLLKNVGKPDGNFLFNYSAVDSSNNSIGIFSGQTASNASGAASVNFTTGNSTYKGVVVITGSLQANPAVKASINVLIN